jgi:hypothetical protein
MTTIIATPMPGSKVSWKLPEPAEAREAAGTKAQAPNPPHAHGKDGAGVSRRDLGWTGPTGTRREQLFLILFLLQASFTAGTAATADTFLDVLHSIL